MVLDIISCLKFKYDILMYIDTEGAGSYVNE